MIEIFQGDCMDLMNDTTDNYYDLAIVDPPYGIGEDGNKNNSRAKLARKAKYYKNDVWDTAAPDPNYFDMLERKSKNQIIFGANHFIDNIPFNVSSPCWVVWDKKNGNNDFADCELAWTSFTGAVRKFSFMWAGMLQEKQGKEREHRIHPTQKPVQLYKWLLKNYAKEGDKILDTHGGSMSSAIACHDMKFDLDIIELDKDYYNAGKKRFDNHIKQLTLF